MNNTTTSKARTGRTGAFSAVRFISATVWLHVIHRHDEYCKVMFCRVCGFRVRVWESYRTSRSFGYGYESVTELPEVPGIVARAYRSHRSSGRVQNVMYPYPGYCGTGLTELTEIPGTGMKDLQNFQKFRVRV